MLIEGKSQHDQMFDLLGFTITLVQGEKVTDAKTQNKQQQDECIIETNG